MTARLAPAVLAVLALAACSGSGTSGAAPTSLVPTPTVTVTVTVTATASPSPSPTALPWPQEVGAQGTAPSPEFPTALTGWVQVSAWQTMPRAFDSTWTPVSDADYGDFPATMNGCENRRSMVRWRAVNENAVVQMRTKFGEAVYGEPVTANAGWLDMDGCAAPEVRLLSSSDGSGLSDVTVSVQQWVPAP